MNPAWVSAERFAEYLASANGNEAMASRLYEWNVAASSALFELIAHFEVLLRNRMIHEIERAGTDPAMPPGSPWLQGAKQIEEVVGRLRKRQQPPTAGRIYAGVTFGFWKTMFVTPGEELWRHSMSKVFRHTRADRHVLSEYLESINQLRNRIAHHGSLLNHDITVEAQKLFRLTSWLDPTAESWLRSIERVSDVAGRRPIPIERNTVVVPGADAWRLYNALGQPAYIFPAGRSVRRAQHLAFYADGQVQTLVPRVQKWYDAVDWNKANAKRLSKSGNPDDALLAGVIAASTANGWTGSTYQVFLLSPKSSEDTLHLEAPIEHSRRGRGSAFVTTHRYVSLTALRSARETDDLRG